MSAFTLTVVGNVIEVLGVFFLSVEAIKLPNLYKLRDKFLLPLDHTLESGIIYPGKTQWTPDELRAELAAVRHFFLSHFGVGLAALTLVILVVARESATVVPVFSYLSTGSFRRMIGGIGLTWIAGIVLAWALLPLAVVLFATRRTSRVPPQIALLATALASFPIGFVPMFLGELCHQGSRLGVRGTLQLLELIARGTPTGTIGIIGFLGVCLGKAVELLADK